MIIVSLLQSVAILSMVTGPVTSDVLYAETAPMSFEVWAADLKPGFVLNEKIIGDRTCYCKNPGPFASYSASTSSFAFNTPGPLTSSGVPASSFDYVFLTPAAGGGGGNNNATAGRSAGLCGQCDMEVTIDDSYAGQNYEWKSPGWDDGQNYPDGCVCQLKVHYRSSNYASVVWTFDPDSSIKSVNNCGFDRIVADINGDTGTWCDTTLPTKSGSDVVMAVDADYTFTFYSESGDGNQVEKGFKLTIKVVFYGR